jgi:hypothetical protein
MRTFFMKGPLTGWRKLTASAEVSIPLGIGQIKLSPGAKAPLVTRFGYDIKDRKTPFYESRLIPLSDFYFGYKDSVELKYDHVYAELRPIACVGMVPLEGDAIDESTIRIALSPYAYEIPPRLRQHADAAVELFKELGKINAIDDLWENNRAVSLKSIDATGRIEARMASYFDQVATNLTLDWESRLIDQRMPTIRSGMETSPDGRLPPLASSCLANTLGTAVMFYSKDLQPLLRLRNATMAAIPSNKLHCTASGVMELPPGTLPGEHGFGIFRWGMEQEIADELGLTPDQYDLYPVAIARELPRGGKPQLFWAAVAKVDDDVIRTAAADCPECGEFIQDADNVLFHGQPDVSRHYVGEFTYEGLACYDYCNRFVSANRDRLAR